MELIERWQKNVINWQDKNLRSSFLWGVKERRREQRSDVDRIRTVERSLSKLLFVIELNWRKNFNRILADANRNDHSWPDKRILRVIP